jgi:hypothetical protein
MMAWLLWARLVVAALLAGLVGSFVWLQLSDRRER